MTASQPRYPFFLSSTYLSHNAHQSIQPTQFFQAIPIHPTMTQSHLHNAHGPGRFPLFLFSLPSFLKTFTLRFPPCFSIISPFDQRLSIIFGCSVRALVIHVSLASARPCDKYNPCPSSLFPSSILTPSSVSSPSLHSSRTWATTRGEGRRKGMRDE